MNYEPTHYIIWRNWFIAIQQQENKTLFSPQLPSVSGNKRGGLCSLICAQCVHLVMQHKSSLCIALNGQNTSSLTKVKKNLTCFGSFQCF